MNLIAWSQNLTPEAAEAAGAVLVSKDQLSERADNLKVYSVSGCAGNDGKACQGWWEKTFRSSN